MSHQSSVELIMNSHGDLLFDLCQALLSSPLQAHSALKTILKKIVAYQKKNSYRQYERGAILRVACQHLLDVYEKKDPEETTLQEQIIANDQASVNAKLKRFSTFFHRLFPEDQLLLLLCDKHEVSITETALALKLPEGSLRIKRKQALETLEEWIWNNQ